MFRLIPIPLYPFYVFSVCELNSSFNNNPLAIIESWICMYKVTKFFKKISPIAVYDKITNDEFELIEDFLVGCTEKHLTREK